MNQKRPEKIKTDRDVGLKENNKKHQRKVCAYLMNCAAPLLTVIFLAGSVCWAAEMQYGDTAEFDTNPEAAAVLSADGIIPKSIGYIETKLPENGDVPAVTENTGAELVEACGIYLDNEFIGAVVSGDYIEEELEFMLEDYKNDESIIEADYAVDTDIKQGLYRSAALVSTDDMTEYLASEKEVVTEYIANEDDTPEKLAEDFDMTVEDIKQLNPELEEFEEGEQVKVKETISVLPVKYTCEVTEEVELDCDIITEDSGNYYSSEEAVIEMGEIGKRISCYEVTYIDGTEVSRKLKNSETVFEPVYEENEEVVEDVVEEADEDETVEEYLYTESIPEIESETETEVEAATGSFIWPVNGGYISDPFLSDRNHKGLDIAADSGTDIYAADGGTVIEAGWNDGGYGYYVMIDHGNGYVTLYGHASDVYVSSGQTISTGELIAAVGTTGDSTGNHCHFEIRYDGNFLNPESFIG